MTAATQAHTRTFPGHRASVADARHWLEGLLARTPNPTAPKISGETVAAAGLLLSEAATNAVRHTATGHCPGGIFTVRLRITDHALTVEVQDDGGAATVPAVGVTPTISADDDESGRGLVVIDAFADEWGSIPEGTGIYYTLARREAFDPKPRAGPRAPGHGRRL